MSIITIVGAGQMGSAMCFPARSNGHEVRLVGTPLDREIIERAKVDRWHLNLKRYLPEGVKYYQIEDMRAALMGADLLPRAAEEIVTFGCQGDIPEVAELSNIAAVPVQDACHGIILSVNAL